MLSEEDFAREKHKLITCISVGEKLHSVLVIDKNEKSSLARGISIPVGINDDLLNSIFLVLVKYNKKFFIPVAIRRQTVSDFLINSFLNILIKGSRFMNRERVLEILVDPK